MESPQHDFKALSATQAAALLAMDVDVYQRRRLPTSAVAPANQAVWSERDAALPLAKALLRAAGVADCADWLASGLNLPDLGQLRADANAKRRLWRQIRRKLPR